MKSARFAAVLAATVLDTVALASIASAQSLTVARDDYPSSLGARGIVAADFNRDGWMDYATANEGPSGLSVLLNRGPAGRGFAASFIPLSGGPFDVAAGDLNKDAIPDVAVANADANTIDILFGRAAGGFTTPWRISTAGNPRGISIADIDGDGNLDVIYTMYQFSAVQIMHGDGKGNMVFRSDRPPCGANSQGIVAGDINLDGRLDLIVASATTTSLTVLLQSSTGSFSRRDVSGPHALNVLVTGDFNADGKLDVAGASTGSSAVDVFFGTGGAIAFGATYPSGPSPRGIAAADVNQDGRLDLMTGNRASSTVSVFLGGAGGAFSAASDYGAGAGSRAVAVADFDHDGRLDIATGNENASTTTVLSSTTSFVRAGSAFDRTIVGTQQRTGSGSATVGIADFDHDGRLDVAVHRWPGDSSCTSPVAEPCQGPSIRT